MVDRRPTLRASPPGSIATARIVAKLEPGWHIYSLTTPEGGPTPTTLKLEPNPAIASAKFFSRNLHTKFDKNFKIDTEIYEKEVASLRNSRRARRQARGRSMSLSLRVIRLARKKSACRERRR